MKGWGGLVVLEALHYRVVDNHLRETSGRRAHERQSCKEKPATRFQTPILLLYLEADINLQTATRGYKYNMIAILITPLVLLAEKVL